MRRFLVKIRLLLVFGFCLGLVPMSLSCYSSSEETASEATDQVDSGSPEEVMGAGTSSTTLTVTPCASYQYGRISGSSDYGYGKYNEVLLIYNDWKKHYITSTGASGYLRVQRDAATNYDTVSEGIGYGMLLAVYFNDQETFDKLYGYCMKHVANTTWNALMHWMVSSGKVTNTATGYTLTSSTDGTNISEFGLSIDPNGHTIPYILLSTRYYTAPSQPVYVPSNMLASSDKTANYKQAAEYSRGTSTATDADADICTALVMASKKWRTFKYYSPSSPCLAGIYSGSDGTYAAEAVRWIQAFFNVDVENFADSSKIFIKAGSEWGGISYSNNNRNGWNPSYFTPAYYTLWAKFLNDQTDRAFLSPFITACSNLKTQMYKHLAIIDKSNGTAGLYPDWCNTYSGTVAKCTMGDRYYYDESLKQYQLMSYNFYYDAVRIPWRLAVDYSWYGTTQACNELTNMGNFFESQYKAGTLYDGYSITGGKWDRANRDGFNNLATDGSADGGINPSTTFYAMCLTPVLGRKDGTNTWYKDAYDIVKSHSESFSATYNYYGNTLRLLSLLYLSGNFTNIYDCKIALKAPNGKYVCADAEKAGNFPLYANRTARGEWETYDLIDLGNNGVALRSYTNGKYYYVCADENVNYNYPPLVADRSGRGDYETFIMTVKNAKTVVLQDHQRRYVVMDSSTGRLYASKDASTGVLLTVEYAGK